MQKLLELMIFLGLCQALFSKRIFAQQSCTINQSASAFCTDNFMGTDGDSRQELTAVQEDISEGFALCGADFNPPVMIGDSEIVRVACNLKSTVCNPLGSSPQTRCQPLPSPTNYCAENGISELTGYDLYGACLTMKNRIYGGLEGINIDFEETQNANLFTFTHFFFNPTAADISDRCRVPMGRNQIPTSICYESYFRSCRASGSCPNDPVSFCENDTDCLFSF